MPKPSTTKDKRKKLEPARPATIIEIAKACEVDEDTVRRWVRAGCPHSRERTGQKRLLFNFAAVRDWLDSRGRSKDLSKRGRPGIADGAPEDVREALALAELRKKLAQAEKAELDLAERKGELLAAADVEAGRVARIHAAKAALLALPGRAAPAVVGRDVREAQRVLEGEVRAILEEFSRA